MRNLIAFIVMAVPMPILANTIAFNSNTIAEVETTPTTTTGNNASPVVTSECKDEFSKCLNGNPVTNNTEECARKVKEQPGCSNFIPKTSP